MRHAEETKTSLLYEMLQTAGVRGIGNCTQVCSHVTEFLTTGVMPIAGWRNVFPGTGTNREFANVISGVYEYNRPKDTGKSDAEKLLLVLSGLLKEGEHVQVRGKMVGSVYETLMIGHVFNAIKIDGEVRLVDCYQGTSLKPWLKQAWDEPDAFLRHFSNFSISNPEESRVVPAIMTYLERKISSSNLPSSVQDKLLSGARNQFGFFNAKGVSQGPENPELTEKAGASLNSGPK